MDILIENKENYDTLASRQLVVQKTPSTLLTSIPSILAPPTYPS